jgi:hypothetical protein
MDYTKKTVEIEGAMKMESAARERYWAEMGIEEKVERLQRMVLTLVRVVNRQADKLAEAHRVSHLHFHSPLGQVVVPPLEQHLSYPGDSEISDRPLK